MGSSTNLQKNRDPQLADGEFSSQNSNESKSKMNKGMIRYTCTFSHHQAPLSPKVGKPDLSYRPPLVSRSQSCWLKTCSIPFQGSLVSMHFACISMYKSYVNHVSLNLSHQLMIANVNLPVHKPWLRDNESWVDSNPDL